MVLKGGFLSPLHSHSHSHSDRAENMDEGSQISDGERSDYNSNDEDGYVEEGSYNSSEDRSHDSGEQRGSGYISDERRPKRRKTMETLKHDRVSAMPDEILLHILSFLPTNDAVKTGTLSHRWLYLWNFVPNLHFACSFWGSYHLRKFATFVDKTLIFHRRHRVNKFTLDFEYKKSFASRVDTWVRFAMSANVEELCLNLLDRDESDPYVLPQHVYTNSSIRKLELTWCDVVPNGLVSWKSLKSLSIVNAELSEDVVQKILVGSPVLESLELGAFVGFNRLDIGSSSLRKLVVDNYWDSSDGEDDSVLEISAPNLQSLGILGWMYRKLRLMNIQSLVDCNLNFRQKTDYEVQQHVLRGLLDKLRHVENLTLGEECIWVVSLLELKGMLSPLSKCRCLILHTYIEKHDIPAIAGLLQSSPILETLIINMTSVFDSEYDFDLDEKFPENYLTSEKGRSKCLPLHLKTVKIVDFEAGYCESILLILLVQFLLEKARVLEKIDINAKRSLARELLQVAQKLLSLPRISPRAVVMLSE